MTTNPNALTPVSEAAIPSSTSRTANFPRRESDRNTRSQRQTAAGRWLRARLERVAKYVKRISGEVDLRSDILDLLDGEDRDRCSVCGGACATVLPDLATAKPCPGPPMFADCSGCGHTVTLVDDRCPTRRPNHTTHSKRQSCMPKP